MVAVLVPALALLLSGAPATAGCPKYWEDRPLRCAWGYVQISPVGMLIPFAGDRMFADPGGRALGYSGNVGAGLFRGFGRFALAIGGRVGYGLTRQRFPRVDSRYSYVHAGPELRPGALLRGRVFLFGLLRAGYSEWRWDVAYRTSIDLSDWRGGHFGVGAGAWARLGGRSFVGGEVVTDLLFSEHKNVRMLSLALVLGLWL